MTTARDICTLALKEAGVLGVGQTALSEDINDSFTLLQRMTAQWQNRRWLVPALTDTSIVADGSISYTVGTGGDFNIPRPNKISAAWVVQNNTGTTPVSLPMYPIFSYEDYARIAVKQLPSLPDHFFYDADFPLGNYYPWPIPNSQYTLHILTEVALGFPTDLDQVFNLPDEYLEALHYNFAVRLFSMYQLPAQASTVTLAKVALNTIKNANVQIPRLSMPPALQQGKSFNIYNSEGY